MIARARGVVAFSSGNHAQGVAWAAKRLGIAATIVMPADAPAAKLEGTLALGSGGRAVRSRDREPGDDRREPGGGARARRWCRVSTIRGSSKGQGSAGDRGGGADGVRCGDRAARRMSSCLVAAAGWRRASRLAFVIRAITVVEPEGWDDMRRSLESSWIEPIGDDPPPTACDALMTKRVSALTFDVLSRRDATGCRGQRGGDGGGAAMGGGDVAAGDRAGRGGGAGRAAVGEGPGGSRDARSSCRGAMSISKAMRGRWRGRCDPPDDRGDTVALRRRSRR